MLIPAPAPGQSLEEWELEASDIRNPKLGGQVPRAGREELLRSSGEQGADVRANRTEDPGVKKRDNILTSIN